MINSKFKVLNSKCGFGLIGTLITITLMAVVIHFLSNTTILYSKSEMHFRIAGEMEDVKNYVNNAFDCTESLNDQYLLCEGAGNDILGRKTDASLLFDRFPNTTTFGLNVQTRARCVNTGGVYEINFEYARIRDGNFLRDPLTKREYAWAPKKDSIPLVCPIDEPPVRPRCASLTANPAVVVINQSTTITLATSGYTLNSRLDGTNINSTTGGSVTRSWGTPGTRTINAQINGPSGIVDACSVQVIVRPPPRCVSLTANPTTVEVNQPSTITIATTGFTLNSVIDGTTISSPTGGSVTRTWASTGTKTINARVNGPAGTFDTCSVQVTVRPPPRCASLTANPSSVEVNQSTTITLVTSSSARSSSIDGTPISDPGGGSVSRRWGTPGTYTINAQVNGFGSSVDTCSVQVTVEDLAPTVTITANGQNALSFDLCLRPTIAWTGENVTNCTISKATIASNAATGWTGPNGSQADNVYANTTYTANCHGDRGRTASASVNITTTCGSAGGAITMVDDCSLQRNSFPAFLIWMCEFELGSGPSTPWMVATLPRLKGILGFQGVRCGYMRGTCAAAGCNTLGGWDQGSYQCN